MNIIFQKKGEKNKYIIVNPDHKPIHLVLTPCGLPVSGLTAQNGKTDARVGVAGPRVPHEHRACLTVHTSRATPQATASPSWAHTGPLQVATGCPPPPACNHPILLIHIATLITVFTLPSFLPFFLPSL